MKYEHKLTKTDIQKNLKILKRWRGKFDCLIDAIIRDRHPNLNTHTQYTHQRFYSILFVVITEMSIAFDMFNNKDLFAHHSHHIKCWCDNTVKMIPERGIFALVFILIMNTYCILKPDYFR